MTNSVTPAEHRRVVEKLTWASKLMRPKLYTRKWSCEVKETGVIRPHHPLNVYNTIYQARQPSTSTSSSGSYSAKFNQLDPAKNGAVKQTVYSHHAKTKTTIST